MRRMLWLFIVLVFIMSFDGVFADNPISVIVNGIQIECAEMPRLKNGIVIVQAEPVLKALAIKYGRPDAHKLSIEADGISIVITAGSIIAEGTKGKIYMDTAASLSNGKILIPATFFRQALGYDVFWDASAGAVKIRSHQNGDSNIFIKDMYPEAGGFRSEQMMWALAADGISIYADRRSFYYLGGADPTYFMIQSRKEALKLWWDISSKEDAAQVIKWLGEEGYRDDFNKLSEMLDTLTEEKYKEVLKYYSYDTKLQNQIKFIKEHYKTMGQKSMAAWDYCNLINVTGLCYMAGYVTEEEAWELTMFAAQTLQKSFKSWEDLGRSYIMGYKFMTGEENEKFNEALEWLLKDEKSPWAKYQWDLTLKREETKNM